MVDLYSRKWPTLSGTFGAGPSGKATMETLADRYPVVIRLLERAETPTHWDSGDKRPASSPQLVPWSRGSTPAGPPGTASPASRPSTTALLGPLATPWSA